MEERKVWIQIFGLKRGDVVRPKYGKCYWEIYSLFPKFQMIKVKRLRRTKHGGFKEVYTTFWTQQIVEVYPKESKEGLGISLPSKLFR